MTRRVFFRHIVNLALKPSCGETILQRLVFRPLVLSVFCMGLAQGAQLSIPALSAEVGQELRVPLVLSLGQDVFNLQIALSWDPNTLKDDCGSLGPFSLTLPAGVHLISAPPCIDLAQTSRFWQFVLECDVPGCGSPDGSPITLAELEFEVLDQGNCSVFVAGAAVNGVIAPGTAFGGTPIAVQVGLCTATEPPSLPKVDFDVFNQGCIVLLDLQGKQSPLGLAFGVYLDRISSSPVCVQLALDTSGSPVSLSSVEVEEIPPGSSQGEVRAVLHWDENDDYGVGAYQADLILQPIACEGASQVNAVSDDTCRLVNDTSQDAWCSAVLWAWIADIFKDQTDANRIESVPMGVSDFSRKALQNSGDHPLATLRIFRDQIMVSSATGRFYADLLEQNNPDLIDALLSSPVLIKTITQEYPPWLEGIQSVLEGDGDRYAITSEMVSGLEAILDGFKESGSERLRNTIEFEEDRLGVSSLTGLTMNDLLARVAEQGGVLHELNFSQYADGPTITSDIVVYNPSQTVTATGVVNLYDLDGAPIDPAQVLTEGSPDFELPPLGSVTFAGRGASGPLRVGSATVKSDRPVSGVIRFFIRGVGVAGVGSGTPMMEVVAPVRRKGQLSTGVAIQNNVNEEITVELQLIDGNGLEVGSGLSQRTIPAWGRLAEFIETLFPEADTTDFNGLIKVRSLAGTIAVIALELETGAEPKFTTLPVSALEP